MEESNSGSQWDIMMTMLIEDKQFINIETYQYHSELSTIEFLNQSSLVNKSLSSWLTKLNEPRERSAELSTHYRNVGNNYHSKNADPDNLATDYFTKAIFSAPNNSIELAYAHSNRAASLYRQLNAVDEGYWDCELAIEFNYPKEKLCKLLQRKLTFSYASNRVDRISETLQQLENLVKVQKIVITKNFNLEREKQKFEEYERQQKDASKASETIEIVMENKKLIEKSLPECGRYIVADETITDDELIYREKAFAFVPVCNDYRKRAISRHCQNCAKTNCIPFPCNECCRASYCSPKCYVKHEHIHEYECAGYRKNLWIKIGIAHLAMRNLLIGFSSLMEKIKHLQNASASQAWDAVMSVSDSDFTYGEVLSLVTNFDKMNRADCMRYALTAKMLAIYLAEYTLFYDQWNGSILRDKSEWQTLVTGILMRHMGQLVCNGHAISDMEIMQPSDYGEDYGEDYIRDKESMLKNHLYRCVSSERVFTGIFPKISLLNHSCDPNIRNSFDGQFLSIYATRSIAQGEQVFNCYGPHYKLMDRDERKSILEQQYCFQCNCDKCATNDHTIDKYYRYVCTNDECGATIDLNGIVRKQWWLDLDDKRICDAILSKFVCGKCNEKLILNPNTLALEFSYQVVLQNTSGKNRDILLLRNVYFAFTKCLSKYHELKQWMTQQILSVKMLDDDDFFCLAYLVIENFIVTRERYGIYSMEFIMATTYALKIINIIQTDKIGKIDRSEILKILKLLNVTQMARAWSILPEATQNYFKICLRSGQ